MHYGLKIAGAIHLKIAGGGLQAPIWRFLLKIGCVLYTIKPYNASKYKEIILKIKPNRSKNKRDPSKNKQGKGWILGLVF